LSDILETLAATLAKQGAPVLGGMIGTAIGGPAGAAIGGLAGKALETLADAFGVPPTPEAVAEAVQQPGAPVTVAAAEAKAPELIRLWEIEARRVSEAQTAEIAHGFTAWQVMRNVIQAIVWGGWTVILASALFGGHGFVKATMPVTDIVTAWGSVTWVWMLVFHGGHTIKEVAPAIMAGFRKAR
jgi:hypothetical protein